jgi:hypothetical protein
MELTMATTSNEVRELTADELEHVSGGKGGKGDPKGQDYLVVKLKDVSRRCLRGLDPQERTARLCLAARDNRAASLRRSPVGLLFGSIYGGCRQRKSPPYSN